MSASACDVLHSYLADPLLYDQSSLYVKGVYENKIEIIPVVLETIQGILREQSSENPYLRLNGLRLLKECIETNNRAFIFNVDSTLITVLGEKLIHRKRRSFLDHKPTAQEEKVNLSFHVLTLECIKVWSHWFPHDSSTPTATSPQNNLHKKPSNFKNVYESLLRQGIKFPQRLHFFRDIDLYKYNLKRRGDFLLTRISQHLRDLEDLEDSETISEMYIDIEYFMRHSDDFQASEVSEHTSQELERLFPLARAVFVPLRTFQKGQIDLCALQAKLKDIFKQTVEMINNENHIGLLSRLSFRSCSIGSQNDGQTGKSMGEICDFDMKCQNAVQSINVRGQGADSLAGFHQCETPNNNNMTYKDDNNNNNSNTLISTNNGLTLRNNRLGSSESSQSEKSSETTIFGSSSSVFNHNQDNENPSILQFSAQDFKRGEIVLNNSKCLVSPLLNPDMNIDDFKLACLKESHRIFDNDSLKIITTSRLQKQQDKSEQFPFSEVKSDKQITINQDALRRSSSNDQMSQQFQLQVQILSKTKSISSVQTVYNQISNSQITTPVAVTIQSDSDDFQSQQRGEETTNIKSTSSQPNSDDETQQEYKLIKKDVISIQISQFTRDTNLQMLLGLVYTNDTSQAIMKIDNILLPISILNSISYQDLNSTNSLNDCLKDWCEPENTKYIQKTPLFAVNPQILLNENSILSYFPSLKRIASASKHFREYITLANVLDTNQLQESSSTATIKFTLISNKCMRVQIKQAGISEQQSKEEKFPAELFLSTIQEIFEMG